MEQYISKSALLKFISDLTENLDDTDFDMGYLCAMDTISSMVNTLEVKDLPIWERVSPDTGQTTLYKDGGKSYLERFGYRIDLKDLDKLPKKNLKEQKGK